MGIRYFIFIGIFSACLRADEASLSKQYEQITDEKQGIAWLIEVFSSPTKLAQLKSESSSHSLDYSLKRLLGLAEQMPAEPAQLEKWFVWNRAQSYLATLHQGAANSYFETYQKYQNLLAAFPQWHDPASFPNPQYLGDFLIERMIKDRTGVRFIPEVFAFYLDHPRVQEFLKKQQKVANDPSIYSSFRDSSALQILTGEQRRKLFEYMLEPAIRLSHGKEMGTLSFDPFISAAIKDPALMDTLVARLNIEIHNTVNPEGSFEFLRSSNYHLDAGALILRNALGRAESDDVVKKKLKQENHFSLLDISRLKYLLAQYQNKKPELSKLVQKNLDRVSKTAYENHSEENAKSYNKTLHRCERYFKNWVRNRLDTPGESFLYSLAVASGAFVTGLVINDQYDIRPSERQKDLLTMRRFQDYRKAILDMECGKLGGTFRVARDWRTNELLGYDCTNIAVRFKENGFWVEKTVVSLANAEESNLLWKDEKTGKPIIRVKDPRTEQYYNSNE